MPKDVHLRPCCHQASCILNIASSTETKSNVWLDACLIIQVRKNGWFCSSGRSEKRFVIIQWRLQSQLTAGPQPYKRGIYTMTQTGATDLEYAKGQDWPLINALWSVDVIDCSLWFTAQCVSSISKIVFIFYRVPLLGVCACRPMWAAAKVSLTSSSRFPGG